MNKKANDKLLQAIFSEEVETDLVSKQIAFLLVAVGRLEEAVERLDKKLTMIGL